MESSKPSNATTPLVSVIMPTYQRAALIAESIESCYAQTHQNFELLVIDDGSTDDTESIVSKYDQRTRYIKLSGNSGPSKARNEGVRQARGEYVAMLDSDDLWHPTKIEKQVALIKSNPDIGWVYCNLKFFGCAYSEQLPDCFYNKYPQRGMILKSILCNSYPMMTPTILVKRSCFLDVGGYDETLRTAEDTDFYNRLAHSYAADYIDEILTFVRRSWEGEFTATGMQTEHHLAILERVLGYESSVYGSMTRDEINSSFVRYAIRAAQLYRREGARRDSLRMLGHAWKYNPFRLQIYRSMLAVILKG